ncbi:MAG: hypothetical protein E6G31_07275 [Actinobacteria bacterium]|nr:MAG: hypothetical protein E6G31_07275 [Actinomycetota bacterium]
MADPRGQPAHSRVTFAHAGSRQRSSSECSSAVAWSKSEPFGAEFANVRVDRDRLCADGVAIGSTPVPYRLDYTLVTGADFVATEVEVTAWGDGWRRGLTLTHSSSDGWTAATQSVGDPPSARQAATSVTSPMRSIPISASHRSSTPCLCCAIAFTKAARPGTSRWSGSRSPTSVFAARLSATRSSRSRRRDGSSASRRSTQTSLLTSSSTSGDWLSTIRESPAGSPPPTISKDR